MAWRVLLVDDHALFREGLAALFAYQTDFVVVGEADDAASALTLAQELKPDLILMDINLPGEDGIEVTRRLKEVVPTAAIVMLTVFDDTDTLLEAFKAGAQGYLVKNMRYGELLEQLRGLTRGEAVVSRRMAARILEEFQKWDKRMQSDIALTQRETEILELVTARLSNKEIAERLNISEYTVKNHIKSILRKLHLRSRHEAAAFGLARGLIRGYRP
ncbi:response regulator transcription factor [Thermomicrobium sp.]|jgi:RNA polymerase sigma factor (sigma-70 family)|uniref:response regulator transcription factor n=1 Tax=Thermomicrobium sp. TaxID=1969469 RepID=UPI001B258E75|nr:response regulator transcription factor [Thermomicrobium sp.]MBO9306858.1 response regulator transcription factor [Thermomicrobium sp.]MBO9350054.1 response regulator transcription factor [Thermomicrobium sp.]